jgi:hypothetical protein
MNPPTWIIVGNMHCPKLLESFDDVAVVAEIPPTGGRQDFENSAARDFQDFVLLTAAA